MPKWPRTRRSLPRAPVSRTDPAALYCAGLASPLPRFLLDQKEEGQETQVPIVGDEVGAMLQLLCSLTRPKRILELGSGIGYSTHWMLLGWPQARITSVDANPDRIEEARAYLTRSGGLPQVRLVNAWAENFLEQPDGPYDLVFLDATKKDYPNLLDQCYSLLGLGGLLVVDNIFYQGKVLSPPEQLSPKELAQAQGMDRFNRKVAAHPGLDSHFLPLGDGLLIARKLA